MNFEDITFECPKCGSKHNVLDWLKRSLNDGMALLDDTYSVDTFLRVGTAGVRFVRLPCECGRDYAIVAYNNAMSILYEDVIVHGFAYHHDYPFKGGY